MLASRQSQTIAQVFDNWQGRTFGTDFACIRPERFNVLNGAERLNVLNMLRCY